MASINVQVLWVMCTRVDLSDFKKMREIFIVILVFTIGVSMYLSQHLSQRRMVKHHIINAMGDIESYDDYEDAPLDDPCYTQLYACMEDLRAKKMYMPKPVCAHLKRFGLTNYFSICEVHLQICVNGQENNKKGGPKKAETYFNGKELGCEYYLEKTKDKIEALKLYYELGEKPEDTHNKDQIDTQI